MLARNRRLAAAGLITAAAIAVPTAALAAGSGSPSAKPTPPASAARSAKPTPPESAAGPAKPGVKDRLPALAAAAGISVDRVQAGLVAMKRAGGNTPAGIAAFAAAAGVSNATAQRVAGILSGGPTGHK